MDIDKNLYYNWQFLRRQPKYREFYDRYDAALKSRDEDQLITLTTEFAKTFSMSLAFDYKDEEYPVGLYIFPRSILASGVRSKDELSSPIQAVDNLMDLATDGDDNKRRFLTLHVDLELYKKSHNAKGIINKFKKEYDDKNPPTGIKRIHSNEENLDRSLLAFDLFLELRPVFESDLTCCYEIAKRLLSKYKNQNSNDAKDYRKGVEQDIEKARAFADEAPFIDFNFKS